MVFLAKAREQGEKPYESCLVSTRLDAFALGLAGDATLDFSRGFHPAPAPEISHNPALQVSRRPKFGYFLRWHGPEQPCQASCPQARSSSVRHSASGSTCSPQLTYAPLSPCKLLRRPLFELLQLYLYIYTYIYCACNI